VNERGQHKCGTSYSGVKFPAAEQVWYECLFGQASDFLSQQSPGPLPLTLGIALLILLPLLELSSEFVKIGRVNSARRTAERTRTSPRLLEVRLDKWLMMIRIRPTATRAITTIRTNVHHKIPLTRMSFGPSLDTSIKGVAAKTYA